MKKTYRGIVYKQNVIFSIKELSKIIYTNYG